MWPRWNGEEVGLSMSEIAQMRRRHYDFNARVLITRMLLLNLAVSSIIMRSSPRAFLFPTQLGYASSMRLLGEKDPAQRTEI